MFVRIACALALGSVVLTASGCCTTLCDCVSCLISGPRLPFAADPDQTAVDEGAAPTTTAASSMPY